MCGRYGLVSSRGEIKDALPVEAFFFKGEECTDEALDLSPRYNIAPTQVAPILRREREGERKREGEGYTLEGSRWGLVPQWIQKRQAADETSARSKEAGFINARIETASEKPSFRDPFARRHCAVPVSCFYEWEKVSRREGGKQPHCIQMSDSAPAGYRKGGVFFMAGIYEPWECKWETKAGDEDRPAKSSFSILTTRPNSIMKSIHDRMPVILSPSQVLKWLGATAGEEVALEDLSEPCPSAWLSMHAVSTRVNSPGHDDASIMDALPEPLTLL